MISKPASQIMLICDTQSSTKIMERIPENLSTQSVRETKITNESESPPKNDRFSKSVSPKVQESLNSTKIKLSFSVDRLLSDDIIMKSPEPENLHMKVSRNDKCRDSSCCDSGLYACCSFPNCFAPSSGGGSQVLELPHTERTSMGHLMAHSYPGSLHAADNLGKYFSTLSTNFVDYKAILRPTPIRAMGSSSESASLCTPPTASYPTLATSALLRFHHHQQQQQKPGTISTTHTNLSITTPLMTPLNGLKSLQLASTNRFLMKAHNLMELPAAAATNATHTPAAVAAAPNNSSNNNNNNNSSNINNSASHQNIGLTAANNGKRKRSWSRAVFTNLQRKGLEIQFQQQKYITKPDRRKLAARLNLTDAQVKVWFQNRRMKWRHTRENLKSGQEKPPTAATSGAGGNASSDAIRRLEVSATPGELTGYSSDCTTSVDLSDNEDEDGDGDEIDVVE